MIQINNTASQKFPYIPRSRVAHDTQRKPINPIHKKTEPQLPQRPPVLASSENPGPNSSGSSRAAVSASFFAAEAIGRRGCRRSNDRGAFCSARFFADRFAGSMFFSVSRVPAAAGTDWVGGDRAGSPRGAGGSFACQREETCVSQKRWAETEDVSLNCSHKRARACSPSIPGRAAAGTPPRRLRVIAATRWPLSSRRR